jgi:hypothetical protein
VITALSVTVCVLSMASSLLVALGKLRAVHAQGVVAGAGYVLINLLLASNGQAGMLFLAVPSAWGVLMSVVGLVRLRRENAKATEKECATAAGGWNGSTGGQQETAPAVSGPCFATAVSRGGDHSYFGGDAR